MDNTLFSLDNRLMLCAQFVRENALLADIGTDHAYLPVWLAKKNKIKSAIAADINEEPLLRGRRTIEKYNASSLVSTRLSNGLDKINSSEADDIVIAGMGGEMIISILSQCGWAKDNKKHFILQPMTRAFLLREFLYENGFEITREQAVAADKRVYSVMLAVYSDGKKAVPPYKYYCGELSPQKNFADKLYIEKEIKSLKRKAEGLMKAQEEQNKICELMNIIDKLEKLTEQGG